MSFVDKSCTEFVVALAGKDPVPGGGGTAALVGALGMALGHMVGSLTVGKKKYADVEEDIKALMAEASALQDELLALVGKDAEVFEPLAKAYGLPKETAEQQAYKAQVMETVLKDACAVPLDIMRACCKAIELHQGFAAKGSAIAISDVGCGVICCSAALQAASLNVFINTAAMKERDYAENINCEANALLEKYLKLSGEIYENVAARLK
ncbi:MAG: cyclodeaminase/cyclohydrolase family protein [Firmicutes bacterium]|nr:cyclodeaminase/cyclohydrolase family protein [Bacillota bacterium]